MAGFDGLGECTTDVVNAAANQNSSLLPQDGEFEDFKKLQGALDKCLKDLPRDYPDELLFPFRKVLGDMEEAGFKAVLQSDPPVRKRQARLLLDLAHAMTQQGRGLENDGLRTALYAAQKVVTDLYDGYFDEAAKQKVRVPANRPLAPLVRWSHEDRHRTWTADQAIIFGPRVPIVAAPVGGAEGGLLGWAILAHEIVGHDVLDAYEGLLPELQDKLWDALAEHESLREYSCARIDELVSDVMGILNMGPAFGIALVGYLRASHKIDNRPPILQHQSEERDAYPNDFLRGFLAVETIRLLKFNLSGGRRWADTLDEEVRRDLKGKKLRIDSTDVTDQQAVEWARIAARALLRTPLKSLTDSYGRQYAIGEFQDWNYQDEELTEQVREILEDEKAPPRSPAGAFAAHIVAGAVCSAVSTKGTVAKVFSRMKEMLCLVAGQDLAGAVNP